MNSPMKPILRDFNPENIFLHVSTNTEQNSKSNCKIICQPLKADTNTITVSLIVLRYDNLDNTISPERHLNGKNFHLNMGGILAFANT